MIDRDRHFALVVGLNRYPQLGDPPPSDLEGPENDAQAVYDWLVTHGGGGLGAASDRAVDSQNWQIAKITSSQWANSPNGAPARDEIQGVLRELARRAEQGRSGQTAQIGRRLYVFAAGHGFSPTLNEGCLHAGDADQLSTETNVFFTRWLRLFQEAGYFRETVLWMDCCMNRDRSTASLPTVQVQISSDPPGPSFVAFAARRPLRAVERPTGPNGEAHGVFTTVLLEGLRGAAVNPYGMITGRSLADWLRNAQLYRIDGPDAEDAAVSKEPEILREDQDLIFADGMKPLTYPIEIVFPPGAGGETARLWSGRPPTARTIAIPAGAKLKLDLPPGMYVVDVPTAQLRGGFQVTAPASVTIDEIDDPVMEPDTLVPFKVEPGEAGAEIFIVDEAFNLVARSVTTLSLQLPFGIYKVRVRSGRRLVEKIHMLDREREPAASVSALPAFASAAPIPGTRHSHEYHLAEAQSAPRRRDIVAGTGGEIMILTREWRPDDGPPSPFSPWHGVRLLDAAGNLVADLDTDGVRHPDRDPCGSLSAQVAPGHYYLRVQEDDGRELERSLIVSEGWRTEAYLLRSARSGETREMRSTRFAALMRRPGGELSQGDALVDHARVALADERLVLGGELRGLLVEKFHNPLAGIIGGHLLIIEHERHPGADIEKLNLVVRNLRDLVGLNHPDVEALSLRCTDTRLRTRHKVSGPPMFLASWRLLVQNSFRYRWLVPAAIAERVQALAADPPFLTWMADELSREKNRTALIRNLDTALRADTPLDDAFEEQAAAVAALAQPQGPDASGSPAGTPALTALDRSLPPRAKRRLASRLQELGLPATTLDNL